MIACVNDFWDLAGGGIFIFALLAGFALFIYALGKSL